MATVEVASPEAMSEAIAPYRDTLEFKLVPIVEVSVAVPTIQTAQVRADPID
jgi:hypothetical protein